MLKPDNRLSGDFPRNLGTSFAISFLTDEINSSLNRALFASILSLSLLPCIPHPRAKIPHNKLWLACCLLYYISLINFELLFSHLFQLPQFGLKILYCNIISWFINTIVMIVFTTKWIISGIHFILYHYLIFFAIAINKFQYYKPYLCL